MSSNGQEKFRKISHRFAKRKINCFLYRFNETLMKNLVSFDILLKIKDIKLSIMINYIIIDNIYIVLQ
jgi:hypothetical protein